MNPELEKLLDHLTLIARELPPGAIDELTTALERLPSSERNREILSIPTTPRARELYAQLVALWSRLLALQPQQLATSLKAAHRAIATVFREQTVDLLWTGPATSNMPMRRSDQGLYELINSAKDEILIVSFAVYRVPTIIESLQEASQRGVMVRFILELAAASGNKITFDIADELKTSLPKAILLYWPLAKRERDERARYGTLHAKCAITDRSVAFISSANLTEYAMELNMELGVLIQGGGLPKRIASHFDELIARRVLVEIQ